MQQLATAARCLLRRPPAQQILLQGSSGRRSFATALSPDDRVAALTKLAREGSPFQWEEVGRMILSFCAACQETFSPAHPSTSRYFSGDDDR
jgi:hypothetical protein